MRLRSNKTKHRPPKQTDPDAVLLASSPPPLLRRTKRDYTLLQNNHSIIPFDHVTQPQEKEVLLAGMSSAASSVVLELPCHPSNTSNKSSTSLSTWQSLPTHKFKPIYTHQFFIEERIKGYRPTTSGEHEMLSILPQRTPIHPSFALHGTARYELSIAVRLAPSGRGCCIVVSVGNVKEGFNMNQVREALDLSREERRKEEVIRVDSEEELVAGRKRRRNDATTDGGNKVRRVMIHPAGIRRSHRRRNIHQVSSDESEEEDVVVVRRSGRTCFPSKKRVLYSIEEGEVVDSASLETATTTNAASKAPSNKIHNQYPSYQTPAFTRGMSLQSCESIQSSSTGDICLDGGKMRIETIVKHLMRGLPKVRAVLLYDGENYSPVQDSDGTIQSLSSTIKAMESVTNDYLDEPIGTLVDSHDYTADKRPMTLEGSGGIEDPTTITRDARFVISLADMKQDEMARRYHDEVEKLAPWWIETADCVNMGLTGGISHKGEGTGHWKVLYLFERHVVDAGPKRRGRPPKHLSKPSEGTSISGTKRRGRPHVPSGVKRRGRPPKYLSTQSKQQVPPSSSNKTMYSLAGYMTILFHGKKMVICQVLILPPYQRSGHGMELMLAAYKKVAHSTAHSSPRKPLQTISQIDVELPGTAFVSLRNRVDYELVSDMLAKLKKPNIYDVPKEYAQPDIEGLKFTSLPDPYAAKIATDLKIIPRQVQIAYEIWLLKEIDAYIKTKLNLTEGVAEMNEQIAELEAHYKSIVKRSLLRETRKANEKFDSLSIEEQQEKLELSFVSTVCHYRNIIM
jgi:hypothetical protein